MKTRRALPLVSVQYFAQALQVRQTVWHRREPEVNLVVPKDDRWPGVFPDRGKRPPHIGYFIARAMLFHHRSCSSAVCHANSPAPVLIVSVAPPTVPNRVALTPRIFARSITFTASS